MVGVLVVLFAILLPVTYVVAWTHYVVLTNRGFEKTVVPIGTDPAVTAAVATTLTNQIFTSLNPQQTVTNALPPKADFLAGPITNAAKGYVQDGVTKALQSNQFQALWRQATVTSPTPSCCPSSTATARRSRRPTARWCSTWSRSSTPPLQNLQGFVSGVVGRPVTLPDHQRQRDPGLGLPDDRQRPRTGRCPDTCGQIPLFPADKLTQARHVVRIFNGVLVLLLILTPVVAAAGPVAVPAPAPHAAATQRRRPARSGGHPPGGGLAHHHPDQHWSAGQQVRPPGHPHPSLSPVLQHQPLAPPGPHRGVRGRPDHRPLRVGPSPCAGSSRTGPGRDGTWWLPSPGGPGMTAPSNGSAPTWTCCASLGVAVAVLLLLVLSVSWVGFLIIAVLLAAYELWLHRLGRARVTPDPETTPGSPPNDPPTEPPAPSEAGSASAV